ncbi:MAG: glycine/sarcosine/betaine reductase selenoprotein B family protein [Alphaproteobacteria bacterium]
MAHIEDLSGQLQQFVHQLECPAFDTRPFVNGPPLARRRVAIISSAALHSRREPPFAAGSTEFRRLPGSLDAGDFVMSHVSVSFDRHGFQTDLNVVFPIGRLRELAAEGIIGSVADTHYSFLGSTDPLELTETADQLAEELRLDAVDGVLLCPV